MHKHGRQTTEHVTSIAIGEIVYQKCRLKSYNHNQAYEWTTYMSRVRVNACGLSQRVIRWPDVPWTSSKSFLLRRYTSWRREIVVDTQQLSVCSQSIQQKSTAKLTISRWRSNTFDMQGAYTWASIGHDLTTRRVRIVLCLRASSSLFKHDQDSVPHGDQREPR